MELHLPHLVLELAWSWKVTVVNLYKEIYLGIKMHLALLYIHIYLTNHAYNLYTVNTFTTNKSKNLGFLLLFQTGENEWFYISQALIQNYRNIGISKQHSRSIKFFSESMC